MNQRPPPPAQPAAVTAFLRGIDRRARLLARVQTGDPQTAQAALTVAIRVFVDEAGRWPLAQWPAQFWRLLLSVPAMGQTAAADATSDVLPDIARLTPPLRAAVLLHLIAGLEDADAGAALGLGVGAYQQRIRSALPRNPQGELDLDVWRGWRDAAQQALEQLPEATPAAQPPPERGVRPATPRTPQATPSQDPPAPPPRRRHGRRLLGLILLVALTAGALLLLHPRGRALIDVLRHRIHVEALPAAAPPKARFDPADLTLDPDRALRAAPDELALARRLPLLAWLAANADTLLAEVPAPQAAHVPTTTTASPLASVPKSSAQRAPSRGAWSEWMTLTAGERAALRATARRLDALPADRQRALAAAYAAQSFDAHRGWHLGPALGRDWPRIAALFAFVPAEQRQPLLDLLRAATPGEIDTLARLAQSTPPQARAQLRRELLAQPRTQRPAWLQAQLSR